VSCGRRAFDSLRDCPENSLLIFIHCLSLAIILPTLIYTIELPDMCCPGEPFVINPAMNNTWQVEVSQGFVQGPELLLNKVQPVVIVRFRQCCWISEGFQLPWCDIITDVVPKLFPDCQ
jgi:hypothetical protein